MATKPTKLEITSPEMSAEELIAQKMQEAETLIAKMKQEAADKLEQANKLLADAAKENAGVKLGADKKTFRQEMNEAAKMSMKARAERQFGKDDWVTFVVPIPQGGKAGDVVPCGVNESDYDLEAGAEYTLPRPIKDVAYRVLGR